MLGTSVGALCSTLYDYTFSCILSLFAGGVSSLCSSSLFLLGGLRLSLVWLQSVFSSAPRCPFFAVQLCNLSLHLYVLLAPVHPEREFIGIQLLL